MYKKIDINESCVFAAFVLGIFYSNFNNSDESPKLYET